LQEILAKNLPIEETIMEYLSVRQYANSNGLPERTVRNWCATGKIQGAFLTGKTWNIPVDACIPKKTKQKESPLLRRLREEKDAKLNGGIYHRTQIDLTYNSNHMEGSKLTHEQTRYIFETNTIGVTDESVNVDDIVETTNHFRCIDYIIDHANEKITESMIKLLHYLLKNGTSDSRKSWFNVGEYKRFPNEVGGKETTAPENVHGQMKILLATYNVIKNKTLDDIIDFHCKFERIHPFQDGNGRVGRLIMFKECLANNIVPFIITEELKLFYYRGLSNWGKINGFLTDTCLTAQDNYKELLEYFKIL
jgi:Fic family protein